MKVKLTHRGDAILVTVLGVAGSGSRQVFLRPGERFQGWKHSRLLRFGEGEHELVTKAQKAAGERLELRGYA